MHVSVGRSRCAWVHGEKLGQDLWAHNCTDVQRAQRPQAHLPLDEQQMWDAGLLPPGLGVHNREGQKAPGAWLGLWRSACRDLPLAWAGQGVKWMEVACSTLCASCGSLCDLGSV